jgi:hypothetical protein
LVKNDNEPDMVTHACYPNIGRLKQKDCEFEASLGYISRPCLKTQNKQQKPGVWWISIL